MIFKNMNASKRKERERETASNHTACISIPISINASMKKEKRSVHDDSVPPSIVVVASHT